MNKQIAEFIGTFTLVLLGCGSAVLAGADIGLTGISFAFGLALIAMAYGIGPSVWLPHQPSCFTGVWLLQAAMSMLEAIKYIIAQVAGAIVAAAVLWVIATGKAGYTLARKGVWVKTVGAQDTWVEYSMIAALVFEIVATFLFMVVIHLVGINVTGVSVNPARSVGPAVFCRRYSDCATLVVHR